MDDIETASKIREKYTHFRILVIGRANAGKTTLLQRVCNTTEEPCIYDEKNNNLLEPTSERGIHDVSRPFAFTSNPQFIFHDSPGFETGDESQLKEVQAFIAKCAEATEVADQLHAIWFCFTPDISRPLLDLEKRFFNESRAGNVPVIAIFTKFDDLITQIYDESLEEEGNRQIADDELQNKFRTPLFGYKFPPRADVCVEDLHDDSSDHQNQVKELIEKTADSLDDLSLKILFVSVQQNNLELCIRYAVRYGLPTRKNTSMTKLVMNILQWFRHAYYQDYDYGATENEELELRGLGGFLEEEERLEENSETVAKFMISKFDITTPPFPPWNVSLAMTAGLILCAESSFWSISKFKSFIAVFIKAFDLYIKLGTKQKVEMALQTLGNWPDDQHEQQNFESTIVNILLQHRLIYSNTVDVSH